ncbi:6,7-dimethyl-8-ribityllumazine synthase [Candidatus Aerophobetes bacterium]|uniref:6,7-dimethyl-8-ribityllumazine synthase n=1 Tax=Aerophobetes bacterium TaxID=2030807 RepID=A0A497E4V9_UNCAE|nr:6,7-dimethyl-8-ribityllumazine synthase [Candidatus Aerophobetes bacterium]RLE09407.1 MAG: 6,7-dimethyl-8-ribityllumazine synthase [Candidatus Aerophobetes bacterium]
MKVFKGKITGKGLRFGIVVSRFNEFITQKLLEGALDALLRHQVREEDIEVVWVPGSFEIPSLASRLARSKRFDALICLGAVIRGATPHFELVATQVARGIAGLALKEEIPIIFGVITADTLEQAIERAGTKAGNRGWDAAISAMEMANLYREIGQG